MFANRFGMINTSVLITFNKRPPVIKDHLSRSFSLSLLFGETTATTLSTFPRTKLVGARDAFDYAIRA